MANKRSSRICSGSLLMALALVVGARGQENGNNGEFKHELPDGVELVDPKSLGLTDVDLSKFLGNVKVLGGGQVGDTKTQILTVGFEGDENINFNDFTIPGLTDGNKTGLPEKDKEIADMAFQKFKEFFQDPNKAKQFEQGNNNNDINGAFPPQKNGEPPKHRSHPQQNNANIHQQQPQFRIPMIQKPYTTPRTPYNIPITTHHPQPPPHHRLQAPPPPPPPQHPSQHHPPRQFNPAAAQTQNHQQQQQQHIFNSQIKSQPPLEFGARIPVNPNNVQARPPPPQQLPQQFQNQHQSQGQFQFQRQQEQRQQHRLTVQHQQQGQNFQRPPVQQPINHNQASSQHFHQQQRGPPQLPQTPRIRFPQDVQPPQQNQPHIPPPPPQPQFPPRGHAPQPPPTNQSPHVPHQPRPPLVQNFVVHPTPQQLQQQNIIPHQQQPPTSREQGRIVRNQLLQVERNNHESNYDGPSKGLLPPPPPQSYQSSTNNVPVHSPSPAHFQVNHQPPAAAATATSSVYIHRGPKSSSSIQQTPFHPQFQSPTRFAKDFTPMPAQTTTSRPNSFEVTPSMKLIPLSTNENAITDPTRMLQLRLYQQQKAQAQASNTHQSQVVLPQQTEVVAPTSPTTTPISITTSYPETNNDHNNQFSSPTQYDFSGSLQQTQQQQQHSFDQNNVQISDNEVYNNAPFSLQAQQQQHQLHFLQNQPSQQQQQQQQQQQFHQSNQPTVFYTQDHRRPPRQGPPPHPPRFQFHVSHELGQGPKFQMHPDPKSLLNTIRRKRGYRRLSNLFNRMFRWDNRQ